MWFFYGISQLFHVIRKLLSIIFNLSMQNLYQSKLRHWWSENMNTCAHMMATVMSFQDPLGRWDSPCPSCWLGLLTASGQVSHSQPHRTPDLRLYPLLPEQQLASRNLSVWRGVQAPGPLSANWDNPEDPSSSRASLRARGWPGPVTAHVSSACFLPSLPIAVHSQAIPLHTFLPANLHFSLFPRKPGLRQHVIKSV